MFSTSILKQNTQKSKEVFEKKLYISHKIQTLFTNSFLAAVKPHAQMPLSPYPDSAHFKPVKIKSRFRFHIVIIAKGSKINIKIYTKRFFSKKVIHTENMRKTAIFPSYTQSYAHYPQKTWKKFL